MENKKSKELNQTLNDLPQKIKKQYPYLSKVSFWYHHHEKTQRNKIEMEIEKKFEINFLQELD